MLYPNDITSYTERERQSGNAGNMFLTHMLSVREEHALRPIMDPYFNTGLNYQLDLGQCNTGKLTHKSRSVIRQTLLHQQM